LLPGMGIGIGIIVVSLGYVSLGVGAYVVYGSSVVVLLYIGA